MKTEENTLVAPWRCEPLPTEIRYEMQLRGLSYDDARAALREQMSEDARRIAGAVPPEATNEIKTALDEADAAKARAEALISAKEDALSSIENSIASLGALRLKIAALERLRLTPEGEAGLAKSALNFYLEKQGPGDCARTQAGWISSLADLTNLKALQPFLSDFLKPLRGQEKSTIANIRALCKDHGVDVRKYLATLQGERRSGRPGTKLDIAGDYSGVIE